MKRFILRFLFIVLFFSIFLFSNNIIYASTNINIDYDYSNTTIDYLATCFSSCKNDMLINNIEKEYFFIFNQTDNDNQIIYSFENDNGFGAVNGNMFYIGFSNNPVISSDFNYCFGDRSSNNDDLLVYGFKCGINEVLSSEGVIGGLNSAYYLSNTYAHFNNLKIYFTNYESSNCNIYDPYNFNNYVNNLFSLNNTESTFKNLQIYSNILENDKFSIYEASISLDDKNWNSFDYEFVNLNEDGSPLENSSFSFYYNIFENGNYHIKLFNKEEETYIYDDYINISNLAFDIYYSTEKTDEPIYIETNVFTYDTYIVYISKDKYDWNSYVSLNYEMLDYTPGELYSSTEHFFYYITKPDTYYFIFVEFSDEFGQGDTYYVKKDFNNLTVADYMSDDYVPKPIISLDFNTEEQSFIIKTQNILLDKALNMKCFYTTDFENNNVLNWTQMDIDFYSNNILEDSKEAYFYFNIPVLGATDTNYRIAFYNYFSNTSGEVVIYEFHYNDAVDYVENELKINLSFSIKFNDLINYFKDRFGFLTYPLDFITNLFNRIININYSEPIINIPAFSVPGTDIEIFSGFTYNFNDVLQNESMFNIYNIYLIAVDFIIVLGLLALSYKIILEVFDK